MAPTLRIRRGDTIRVKAVNGIGPAEVNIDAPQPTNIHYHGMDVAPKRRDGDNVFIRIKPEQDLRYDVFVPDDHPQGLHWYHAHVHTYVDDQIGSGISGMLIVGGFIFEQYPELFGQRQRVMVLKDFTFPGFIDGDARAKSLNGYANPPIRARPGEWQIWQLGNLGADAFFDMKLDGHEVWLIERDGNLLLKPVKVDHVFLPPGARAVVVVQAGAAGEYAFHHLNVDTGPAGRSQPAGAARHVHRLGRPGARGQGHPQAADPGPRPAQPDRPQPSDRGPAEAEPDALHRLLRERRRQHVLHQQQGVCGEPHRHDDPGRPSRAMDRAQFLTGAPCIPPPSDRVPDQALLRRPQPDPGRRAARRDQHPLRPERPARLCRDPDPVHQPDHRRRVRLSLPSRRSTRTPA